VSALLTSFSLSIGDLSKVTAFRQYGG